MEFAGAIALIVGKSYTNDDEILLVPEHPETTNRLLPGMPTDILQIIVVLETH